MKSITRRDAIRLAMGAVPAAMGQQANTSRIVYPGPDGRLVYVPDELGNCIPDFSNCGYMGGGVALPDAPVRVVVEPGTDDATERIQRAIDEVSQLDLDERGFRGAVLLARGRHNVAGTLRIEATGIVLRGEGQGEDDTVLVGTGRRQRTLIEVRGYAAGRTVGRGIEVTAEYLPVGERLIPLASTQGLSAGDTIVVRRVGNAAWISEIGMDRITPRPDDPASTVQWTPFNLDFERYVVAVDGNSVLLNAPITCAIEKRWGGGQVLRFDDSGRLFNVGIEHLRGVSEFDPSVRKDYRGERYYADEQHAWTLISLEAVNCAWVRNVTALHFGFAAVDLGRVRWVTVENCECLDMVSEITGSRRYSFNLEGQLCLVRGCSADTGRHDFVVGSRVCGPNVFLYCKSGRAYATSEPHHRWSVGGLYDNVKAPLAIQDRQYYGTGHGWAGANYVVWNCEGSLVCQRPPTANNWAIGHVGRKEKGDFEPREDGYWESFGRHVIPESLYLHQLADRLGAQR